ncbi:MAG: hypothetical protein M3Z84_01345 [Actinomycetota bacterium]|nr:hypothetical protein [Actinomycetota bacterium]
MLRLLAAAGADQALGLGLVLTTFGLGFRHGIDWDHIAALTDITSSQGDRRRSMFFATLYALGHALVVFVLGVFAIVLAAELPRSVDAVMQRFVGATLIALGVYVVYALIKHGRDFRLRSRWMLLFDGARRGVRWARSRRAVPGTVEVLHDRDQADPFLNYGKATAFGVGMIHGLGAETPTQVLIFLAATGAGGTGVGLALLVCFVLGLIGSNTLIAVAGTFGFLGASRNFKLYVAVSVLIAGFSLVIGTLFLFGRSKVLPGIFGG